MLKLTLRKPLGALPRFSCDVHSVPLMRDFTDQVNRSSVFLLGKYTRQAKDTLA